MSEITIPPGVFIPCPAKSFRNRPASACLSCPVFEGVIDVMPQAGPDVGFDKRYRIACAHAVARRCGIIEVADDGAQ